MKIKEIALLTKHLEELKQFYETILELPLIEASKDKFTVLAGHSYLTFAQTENNEGHPFYHFAFDIPHNKVDEAIAWLESKQIYANLLSNNSIKTFSNSWNSTSIYFDDPTGNIIEFIARHSLHNEVTIPFSKTCILNISEIGLVVNDVTGMNTYLNRHFELNTYKDSNQSFAAVGDEQGLFILSNYNRIWLGSNKRAEIFKTEVVIEGKTKGTYSLTPYPYTIIIK